MKLKVSPYAWVSFSMIVGVMGTALISPLYALYKAQWQLQTSQITLIYVLYMAGALTGLLFLGRLPDRLGFRPIMKIGLLFTLSGTLLCLFAKSMPLLIAGRILVGISSSMLITSASLGLSLLSRNPSPKQTATMTGFLMAAGFGLGPLLGGIMGQWAPQPLRDTYLPVLLLGALGWLALHHLKLPKSAEPERAPKPLSWRELMPSLTWPEARLSRTFALTCVLPFLAFGVFGLYASMSPLFLDKLVPWHGPVVSGTAIAVILLASACVQIMASRVPTHWCGGFGLLSLVLSNALLLLNLQVGSGLLFGLGVALAATGHGMSMLAGMSMVNQIATPKNRSGLLATYLVVGYMGSILPMLGMGWIADHWGIAASVASFCGFVVVMGSVTALLFQRNPHMRHNDTPLAESAGHENQPLPEGTQASR